MQCKHINKNNKYNNNGIIISRRTRATTTKVCRISPLTADINVTSYLKSSTHLAAATPKSRLWKQHQGPTSNVMKQKCRWCWWQRRRWRSFNAGDELKFRKTPHYSTSGGEGVKGMHTSHYLYEYMWVSVCLILSTFREFRALLCLFGQCGKWITRR